MGVPGRDGIPGEAIHVFVPRLSFQTDQGPSQSGPQQAIEASPHRASIHPVQYNANNSVPRPSTAGGQLGAPQFGPTVFTSYGRAIYIPPPAEPEPGCIECWATLLAHSSCLTKIIRCFRCCGCGKVAGKLQEYNMKVDYKDKLEDERRKTLALISQQNLAKAHSSHKANEQERLNDAYSKIFHRLDMDIKEKLLAHLIHHHPAALKNELERKASLHESHDLNIEREGDRDAVVRESNRKDGENGRGETVVKVDEEVAKQGAKDEKVEILREGTIVKVDSKDKQNIAAEEVIGLNEKTEIKVPEEATESGKDDEVDKAKDETVEEDQEKENIAEDKIEDEITQEEGGVTISDESSEENYREIIDGKYGDKNAVINASDGSEDESEKKNEGDENDKREEDKKKLEEG